MGQKTHPLGFRLGITQSHKSNWFSKFNNYSIFAEEDEKIRTHLAQIAKESQISDILISRNGQGDQIELTIETARPGILVGQNGSNIENLSKGIKKKLLSNRKISIKIVEIEPSQQKLKASLVADSIVEQLEKRVAFKRAIREEMKYVFARGIKVQVSGRLNGAEIARSEWVREGRVPLQTLRADIDYCTKEANTIYGVLGVKVWLFKNEILAK